MEQIATYTVLSPQAHDTEIVVKTQEGRDETSAQICKDIILLLKECILQILLHTDTRFVPETKMTMIS